MFLEEGRFLLHSFYLMCIDKNWNPENGSQLYNIVVKVCGEVLPK